jgi:hypothetical protein
MPMTFALIDILHHYFNGAFILSLQGRHSASNTCRWAIFSNERCDSSLHSIRRKEIIAEIG